MVSLFISSKEFEDRLFELRMIVVFTFCIVSGFLVIPAVAVMATTNSSVIVAELAVYVVGATTGVALLVYDSYENRRDALEERVFD
jgi:hypothetical protein